MGVGVKRTYLSKKVLAILTILFCSIFFLCSWGFEQKAEAAELSGPTLYYGNGTEGWTLYLDESHTNEFIEGKGTAGEEGCWLAGENTLTLNSFHYTSNASETYALSIDENVELTLIGESKISTNMISSDAIAIRISNGVDAEIKGSGSLEVAPKTSLTRTVGIEIQNSAKLSVDGAKLVVEASPDGRHCFGIYSSDNGELVIENGASVYVSAGDINSTEGKGLDFPLQILQLP